MGQRKNDGLRLRGKTYWMSFNINGRRFRRSTGTDNKDIARRIYDITKGEIALGKWNPETLQSAEKKEYSLKELAEKYKEFKKGRLKSKHSVSSESSIMDMLLSNLGDMALEKITTQRLEELQSYYLGKGNLPATVNRKFDVLKNMFTKANDWDMVSDETLKCVRKCKHLKMNNQRLRYLSKEECIELVDASEPHLKPIVITAVNTGCRKGEILSLTWEQIDLKHGFIHLERTKNGERRDIPINDSLRATLQGITRRIDVPHVFYSAANGKPFGDVKKAFHSALRRAKIQNFHFHDLRHTFASHLVMAGVDITTVSRLLGHKSLTMTLRYAHLSPQHGKDAVQRIGHLTGRPILREKAFGHNLGTAP